MGTIRDAAIALSKLRDRKGRNLDEIADHLVGEGCIVVPLDLERQYKNRRARVIIAQVRRFEMPDGEGNVEMIALPREPGQKQMTFKFVQAITKQEAVDICASYHKRVESMSLDYTKRAQSLRRELAHRIETFTKTFGKGFQKLLPFDVPKSDDDTGTKGKGPKGPKR